MSIYSEKIRECTQSFEQEYEQMANYLAHKLGISKCNAIECVYAGLSMAITKLVPKLEMEKECSADYRSRFSDTRKELVTIAQILKNYANADEE